MKYILDNYVMIFELVGLLIILFISVHIPKKVKLYTRIAIILLALSAIAYNVEQYTQTFEYYTIWRSLLTATKYTLFPLILIMLILVISHYKITWPKKYLILLFVPELICIPLYYSSQWTHIVFYMSEENDYHGGPISRLPYVIFGLYLLVFLIINFYFLSKYSIRSRIIAIYIILGSITCIALYMIYGLNVDYTPIFTSALVFYYLFIYIHMASIDTLTGLMNRQTFYQDVEYEENKIKAIVSIDMNELKYVNDTYGHAEGDNAIKTISDVFFKYSGMKGKAYRIGGDEFVITYKNVKEQDVISCIDKMKEELAKTKYSCAFGYAMIGDGDKFDDIMKMADERMYTNKELMKKETINNGGVVHNR